MQNWTDCPRCGTRRDPRLSSCPACKMATPNTNAASTGTPNQPVECPSCSCKNQYDAAYCQACGKPLTETVPNTPPQAPSDADRVLIELQDAVAPHYEVLERLGEGGMGTVYLARESAVHRLVAIKVLAPHLAANQVARERFRREALAAAALSHPNVVPLFVVGGTRSETPYMIMQYVEGQTLREWMDEHAEGAAESDARRILGELACALEAAHRHHIVHRDIKPSNVVLEKESGRVLVMDFGVSVAVLPQQEDDNDQLTATGVVVGTPKYMSPEQASGEAVTAASDVYSLGLLAYQLLTGDMPYSAPTPLGWLAAHVVETSPSVAKLRPDVSPDLALLVDRCLSKRPAERPSPQDIARGMLPSPTTELPWPPPGMRTLRARVRTCLRIGMASAALGLLLLLVIAFSPEPLYLEEGWWRAFAPISDIAGSTLGVRPQPQVESNAADFGLWRLALVLTAIGFLFALVTWAIRVNVLLTKVVRYRELGWRADTILDAAADHDSRSGLIREGQREFAVVDARKRDEMLKKRRAAMAALFASGVWGVVSILVWSLLVATGSIVDEGVGPFAGAVVVAITGIPFFLACTMAVHALRRERKMVGSLMLRISHSTKLFGDEPVSESGMTAWYAVSARGEAPAPCHGWVPALARTCRFAGNLVFGAGVLSLVSIAAASWVSSGFVQRMGPETAALAAAIDRVNADDPLGEARAIWQAYLPAPDPMQKGSELSALLLDTSGTLTPSYPFAPESVMEDAKPGNLSGTRLASWFAGNADYPRERVDALTQFGDHPRTAIFQALARAQEFQLVPRMSETRLAQHESVGDLPEFPAAIVRQAAYANALGALGGDVLGNAAEASERLGENLAFANRLLDDPQRLASRVAVGILQDLALLPLAALAERRGDSQEAEKLRRAAELTRELAFDPAWSRGAAGFAANPISMVTLEAMVQNHRILPEHGLEALFAALDGFCANPRELLNRVHPAREAAARSVLQTVLRVHVPQQMTAIRLARWRAATGLGGSGGTAIFTTFLKRLRSCMAV